MEGWKTVCGAWVKLINSQRWWYMGHDWLSMEGWKNVCEAWVKLINSQRWWYLGHDRLSMEGWKNVREVWVKWIYFDVRQQDNYNEEKINTGQMYLRGTWKPRTFVRTTNNSHAYTSQQCDVLMWFSNFQLVANGKIHVFKKRINYWRESNGVWDSECKKAMVTNLTGSFNFYWKKYNKNTSENDLNSLFFDIFI